MLVGQTLNSQGQILMTCTLYHEQNFAIKILSFSSKSFELKFVSESYLFINVSIRDFFLESKS